jgi:hypothetical protein
MYELHVSRVLGIGPTSVSGIGLASVSGIGPASVSGIGPTSVSGIGRTSVSGIRPHAPRTRPARRDPPQRRPRRGLALASVLALLLLHFFAPPLPFLRLGLHTCRYKGGRVAAGSSALGNSLARLARLVEKLLKNNNI